MAYEFVSEEERQELIGVLRRISGASWVNESGYKQLHRAAEVIEQDGKELEKLREEQRSAVASHQFSKLPTRAKPDSSVSCAQGDHQDCLLKDCTCDCHKEGSQ